LDFSDVIIFSISLGIVYFIFVFEQGSFYEDNVWGCYNLMTFIIFNVTGYCQLLLRSGYWKNLQVCKKNSLKVNWVLKHVGVFF